MYGEGKGLGERQEHAVRRSSVLQALDRPGVRPRDMACAAVSHQINGTLDPAVPHVKTGTPIEPGPSGWVICPVEKKPIAFAGNHHTGGERFAGYREITIETYRREFVPGRSYDITHVDDQGQITLTMRDGGSFRALSESQILLDVGMWQPPVEPEAVTVEPTEITEDVAEMPRLVRHKADHRDDDEFELPDAPQVIPTGSEDE